jgi:hypothetical protein
MDELKFMRIVREVVNKQKLRINFNPGTPKNSRWTGHLALTQRHLHLPNSQMPVLIKAFQLVAERALAKVADVYALALTHKELWWILEPELYRTDILQTKEVERETSIRLRETFQGMQHIDQQGPPPRRTAAQRKLMKEMHIRKCHLVVVYPPWTSLEYTKSPPTEVELKPKT